MGSITGKKTIGYILSLEGADSIVSMQHLEKSYEAGLRAIGPAHYSPGTYALRTSSISGIDIKGKELLKQIEKLNLILEATHLCDQSFWETMAAYNGLGKISPVIYAKLNSSEVSPRRIKNNNFNEVLKN